MLAEKDKKAIAGILQGLFVDAPVMHRAEPGSVDIAASEPMKQETKYSSSISSLAANKKTAAKEKTIESAARPDLPEAQINTAA